MAEFNEWPRRARMRAEFEAWPCVWRAPCGRQDGRRESPGFRQPGTITVVREIANTSTAHGKPTQPLVSCSDMRSSGRSIGHGKNSAEGDSD